MTVKSLLLVNFRNYGRQYVEFSDKTNILVGDNAQGKTNVLEAIFLCSTGRSHRTQKDSELIKFGEEAAKVELEFERKNYGAFRIGIEIQRSGGKSVIINGVPQKRAGDLLGGLNSVIFSPEDLSIIKGEPQIRRRFLDMFISQIKPAYYFNLHGYLSALRQRNALLRQSRDNPGLLDTIGAWDAQLAGFGSKIMRERIYFIGLLGEYAKNNHSMITGGLEKLSVGYDMSLKAGMRDVPQEGSPVERRDIPQEGRPVERGEGYAAPGAGPPDGAKPDGFALESYLRDAFTRELENGLQADIARAATAYGPHKDDIACSVGGRNIRLYGSQGQQRTAALSLKMAQVDVMVRETGDTPALLLDDVMSELDRGRQENISLNMKNAQLFLTGADINGLPGPDARYFRVENGLISLTPA